MAYSKRVSEALNLTATEARKWLRDCSDADLQEYLEAVSGHTALYQYARDERERRTNAKLLKPHWTMVPTFYIVIAGLVISVIALIVAVGSWRSPVPVPTQPGEGPKPKLQSTGSQPSMTATSPVVPAAREP
jgi:hypothetical protein